MLEAMSLVDVRHFIENVVCRKRSYDPITALTQTSIFRDYDYFEYISE